MKKTLFAIIGMLLLGSELAFAEGYPVFSASLGGGAGAYTNRGVRRSVYRPGVYGDGYVGGGGHVVIGGVQQAARAQKKIVLKYNPDQITLSEEQMEKLMPLVRRMQAGKVAYIDIIGIDKSYNATTQRHLNLDQVFNSYSPNIKINFREISGAAVVPSNDHTIEIVEYR